MQLSDKPTAHILVRARTDSESDSCDLAIIYLSEEWKKQQQERLAAANALAKDNDFRSLCFRDGAVNFYEAAKDGLPDADELLGDKCWAFVVIDDAELNEVNEESLDSSLDCHRLVIDFKGDIKYTAYGKYTGDEFWTDEFPLQELLEKL